MSKKFTLEDSIAMHEQARATLREKADQAATALDAYRRELYNRKREELGPRAGQQYLRDETGDPVIKMAPMVILDGAQDRRLQDLEKDRIYWESEFNRIGRKIGELKKLLAQAQAAQ